MAVVDKDVIRILAGSHASSNPGDRAVLDEWLENNQVQEEKPSEAPVTPKGK